MRYVRVTVLHQPDAGQHSTSHFSYQEPVGHADLATARQFAFSALGEEKFQKGFVRVGFAEAARYCFRFERRGVFGFELTQAQERESTLV